MTNDVCHILLKILNALLPTQLRPLLLPLVNCFKFIDHLLLYAVDSHGDPLLFVQVFLACAGSVGASFRQLRFNEVAERLGRFTLEDVDAGAVELPRGGLKVVEELRDDAGEVVPLAQFALVVLVSGQHWIAFGLILTWLLRRRHARRQCNVRLLLYGYTGRPLVFVQSAAHLKFRSMCHLGVDVVPSLSSSLKIGAVETDALDVNRWYVAVLLVECELLVEAWLVNHILLLVLII